MLTSRCRAPPCSASRWARTRCGRVLVGEVGRDVGGAAGQRLGQLAQQLLAAGDEDQLGPGLAREPDRGRLADPRRGTGNQLRLSFPPVIAPTLTDQSLSCKDGAVEGSPETHRSRLSAVRREGERVTPLELFFDLVFVLAITQCTALMSHDQTWSGLAQGLLVLGVLWWAWVGYAWLTSVIDPEAGAVRAGHLRRDGGDADRLALRPGGLRQPRPHLRPRRSASSAPPTSPSSCSPAPTTRTCAAR